MSSGRTRVLVVDDNVPNQELVAEILARRGVIVDVAGDGAQAVQMVANATYDCVLMDCRMPGVNGFQATRIIRASQRGEPRLPIIAMTAHAMEEDREECLAAGMDDHIAKPYRIAELVSVLRRWVPIPERPESSPASADAER